MMITIDYCYGTNKFVTVDWDFTSYTYRTFEQTLRRDYVVALSLEDGSIEKFRHEAGFTDSKGRDVRGDVAGGAFSTKGHLTGSARRILVGAGMGELLPVAFYYDARGRLIQSRARNHLGGYDVVALSLSFDGRVLGRTDIHSTPDTLIVCEREFGWTEDLLPDGCTLSVNGVPAVRLVSTEYDSFRRPVHARLLDAAVSVDYAYNDAGELVSIKSPAFSQFLYREEAPPNMPQATPLLNGRICAEKFSLAQAPATTKGRSLSAGYVYTYEGERLAEAAYMQFARSDMPLNGTSLGSDIYEQPDYSVSYKYNEDGAPVRITRHGLSD